MTISMAAKHSVLLAIMGGAKDGMAPGVVEALIAEGHVVVYDVIAGQTVDAKQVGDDLRKPRYELRLTASGQRLLRPGDK